MHPMGIMEAISLHPYAAAGGQAALAVLLAWAARRDLASSLAGMGRGGAAGLALAGVAAVVAAAGWVPAFQRHGFEGHEADYLDAFTGRRALDAAWDPMITYPAMRGLYRALGSLPAASPEWMVGVSLLCAAASAVSVGLVAWLLLRDRIAAVAAAAVAALSMHHVFWASSAYNVILPLALYRGALVFALAGARRAPAGGGWALAAGAALAGMAAACRIESAVVLPAGAWALAWSEGSSRTLRSPRSWVPAAALAVASLAVQVGALVGPVADRQGEAEAAYFLGLVAGNLRLVSFLAPFHHPAAAGVLLAGAVALAASGTPGRRALVGALGLWAIPHLALSTFNDFAPRHALAGATGLCVIAGAAVGAAARTLAGARGGRARVVATALAGGAVLGLGIPLARDLERVAHRYYADDAVFLAEIPPEALETPLTLEDVAAGGCYVLSEQESISARLPAAGSHFNLDPLNGPRTWAEHGGCVRWLYDRENYRWSSRDVHSRATRLFAQMEWRVEGMLVSPKEFPAVVYRLSAPPPGLPGRAEAGAR
ncbi:hypothetical protein L6R50_22790 [Myxococcota bacterium]|nr:hypothetical protein [Myxococcota bacterium]